MSPTRIYQIEICDFRGFPGELVPPIKLDGKNLLVYGENGSGKSTVFEALFQLLDPREKLPFDANLAAARCLKNCFTDEALTVGRVVLDFTLPDGADAIPSMRWSIGGKRPTNHPFFHAMARQRGFLDYRAMLQTHFAHRESEGINLFPLIVDVLLREVEFPTTVATFGGEWLAIQAEGRKWLELANRDVALMDDAEKISYGLEPPDSDDEEESPSYDEGAAFQAYVGARRQAIGTRIGAFNIALWQRVQEIQTVANRFIKTLDLFLDLDFEYRRQVKEPDLAVDLPWPGEPELLLRSNFRNRLLRHPGGFLNEARLTAIALAFYLAALKVEVPESAALTSMEPRLLVLDDVLIGLDMAHRLPVLDLLEREFKNWQVLLFTFDRAWYEIAKQQLRCENWNYYELYAIQVGDHEQPLLLPDEDHLYRALAFLDAGQVKAASVHVRTAFELVLKYGCQRLGLAVKFQSDPRKVQASDLWGALNSAEISFKPARRCYFDSKGKVSWWQPSNVKKRVVSPSLYKRIEHAVSWILNPLNHSQTVDRYRAEIEDATYAIDDLNRAVKHAIAAPSVRLTAGVEELISLLKAYIASKERARPRGPVRPN
jgi:energy-coupling factor transporter ATP-binding protein EcfA2